MAADEVAKYFGASDGSHSRDGQTMGTSDMGPLPVVMKRRWKMPFNSEVLIRRTINLYYYPNNDNDTFVFMEMKRRVWIMPHHAVHDHILDQITETKDNQP